MRRMTKRQMEALEMYIGQCEVADENPLGCKALIWMLRQSYKLRAPVTCTFPDNNASYASHGCASSGSRTRLDLVMHAIGCGLRFSHARTTVWLAEYAYDNDPSVVELAPDDNALSALRIVDEFTVRPPFIRNEAALRKNR